MASVYPILLFTNKIINSEIMVDSVGLEPCCKSRHRESERERERGRGRERERARKRERERESLHVPLNACSGLTVGRADLPTSAEQHETSKDENARH